MFEFRQPHDLVRGKICTEVFMPRTQSRYKVYKRKDTKKFMLTINPVSGLPESVCKDWYRVSFSKLPRELAHLNDPKTQTQANIAAEELINFLKKQLSIGVRLVFEDVTIGDWLVRFTSLENNPRSERLSSEGMPYSPDTIALYEVYYNKYLKDDPFLDNKMSEVIEADARSLVGRLGLKKNKFGQPIVGTRAFEIINGFVRMAFHEYEQENKGWRNPFRDIKPPKGRKPARRDALDEDELLALFQPYIFNDPLQKAVCAAMFYAGLRRSEIFALRPEDLDWQYSRIKIRHAWKRFGSNKKEIGDPKCHKTRETIFPDQLKEAIKELWEAYGKHEFVFCKKDGSFPKAQYIRYWLPKWLKKAGINTEDRNIVPHSSRHSFGSILEANGTPLRYIQNLLGHSTMETTLGYLHESANTMNKLSKKMSEVQEKMG